MSVSLSNSITRRHSVLNDVIENDVMYSWMNMHTLLASRPNVVASTRVDDATRREATRHVRCERGLTVTTVKVDVISKKGGASFFKNHQQTPFSNYYYYRNRIVL